MTTVEAAALAVFEFTIPGEAVPFARAGGGKTVVRFTPSRQRNAMGTVAMYCRRAMGGHPPLVGPIELSIKAVYLRPKSRPHAHWKSSRPDADNLSKLIKDALNKIAWRDDAQVCSLHVWKQFGTIARTQIRIAEMAEP